MGEGEAMKSGGKKVIFYFMLFLPLLLVIPSPLLPLWSFQLNAPLYGQKWLTVVVHPLWGVSGDLQEINIVNHYVGLGRIGNEEIQEIAYLPYVYLLSIFLAILSTAAFHLKKMRLGKLSLYLYPLALSLCMWLYNYTHTITPGAAIKIEPFDPPFIGEHRVANFVIRSFPDLSLALLTASPLIELFNAYRLTR
jgi:copper chaperone NosL